MAMKTKEGLVTQSFMLAEEDIRFVEVTQTEGNLTNKSAALRQLLEDARSYRQLKSKVSQRAKAQVTAEIALQLARELSELKP